MDGHRGWSTTDAAIYRTLEECVAEGTDAAVATVTDVEGSAYRRPGAKMVVPEEGEYEGAVTAGCLEDPIADLGRATIDDGGFRTETFDLTASEDELWGMGLGCNGVVDVLVEPLDDSFRSVLDAIAEKSAISVLTVVGSTDETVSIGGRVIVTETGAVERTDARGRIPDDVLAEVRDEATAVAGTGRGLSVAVETGAGSVTVFVDGLAPVPDLLLFGHQRDVNPIAELGSRAGFRVVVASARGGRATSDRFPAADVVTSVRPSAVAETVDAPEHTYAVLLSHNFLDDRLALDSLLDTAVPYVGLMGPRERFEEMKAAFEEEGQTLSKADYERVATPVGLDIGGDSPTEIAFSVVSEVLAVRNSRAGGRLSEQEGPIHERVDRA